MLAISKIGWTIFRSLERSRTAKAGHFKLRMRFGLMLRSVYGFASGSLIQEIN